MPEGREYYRGSTLFEAELEVVSALHIGAGFANTDGVGDDVVEIAAIMRGVSEPDPITGEVCENMPVLTPTGLKGAMRALLRGMKDTDRLFGTEPKDGGVGGAAGCLVVAAALVPQGAVGQGKRLIPTRAEPEAMRDERTGTYRAVRTAMDPAHGVPANRLLHSLDMVPAGTRFAFRLRLFGSNAEAADDVALLLATIQRDGLRLGRGRGDGQGLVRLSAFTAISRTSVQGRKLLTEDLADEWSKRIAAKAEALGLREDVWSLELSSDEPFLVMASRDASNNLNKALRDWRGHAELPGSSLMGALRARAEWLRELRALRGTGLPDEAMLLAECFGMTAEQQKCRSFIRELAVRIGVAEPTITGFAGLLVVDSIEVAPAATRILPSVKIDRFTQAPMDGALFETEAFVGPRISVRLRLRPHPQSHRREALRSYINDLLSDLTNAGPRQGIVLGHGGNRGFGWFNAEVAVSA